MSVFTISYETLESKCDISAFLFFKNHRSLASYHACLMAIVLLDPILRLQILVYYLNLESRIFAM